MRVMDAHVHVDPRYAGLALEVMDRCGIECCVTLGLYDAFGDRLLEHLRIFGKTPGRFIVFANLDWRPVHDPDFGERAAADLRAAHAAGARGLKIFKRLGLEIRDAGGALLRVNDPRLDPVWRTAGDLRIPVLIHTADPAAFWQPSDARNFWNGVLFGAYAWWAYYRKEMPSPEALLAERNDVIARHPGTTFIAPHVGSKADRLDSAADDLDALPNLYMDLSARIPILGCSERRARHAREFLIEYQDRILFGTDSIYDETNVPTGMQAQCLYQPGEVPLGSADARERYIETTVAFFKSHIEFLTADTLQTHPPFRRHRDGVTIRGLHLPPSVCDRILYRNAAHILGMTPS